MAFYIFFPHLKAEARKSLFWLYFLCSQDLAVPEEMRLEKLTGIEIWGGRNWERSIVRSLWNASFEKRTDLWKENWPFSIQPFRFAVHFVWIFESCLLGKALYVVQPWAANSKNPGTANFGENPTQGKRPCVGAQACGHEGPSSHEFSEKDPNFEAWASAAPTDFALRDTTESESLDLVDISEVPFSVETVISWVRARAGMKREQEQVEL